METSSNEKTNTNTNAMMNQSNSSFKKNETFQSAYSTQTQGFNVSMYFTDEVKLSMRGDDKYVNEFKVLKNIGKGSFSKVKHVVREFKDNEAAKKEEDQEPMQYQEFAMKMMHKPTLSKERAIRYDTNGQMEMINNLDKVYNEIEIWRQANHPNICKLYELIDAEDHDYIYLIIELADLGQIATWDYKQEQYIQNQKIIDFVKDFIAEDMKDSQLPEIEQVAQFLFRQLLAAIVTMHDEMNIIHRDIKPDNILFNSNTASLKLTDFTVARGDIKPDTVLFDSEGTACFTAPECHVVDKEGYKPQPTDIWSFGVCLYTFVCGRVPFYGECELEIQIASKQQELQLPETFSDQLKDVLTQVLNKDPAKRPTAQQLTEHPFFICEQILDLQSKDSKVNLANQE